MIILRNTYPQGGGEYLIEQREFARKDYAGLTESEAATLAKKRSEIAKDLIAKRNRNNIALGSLSDDGLTKANKAKLQARNNLDLINAKNAANKARENIINNRSPLVEHLANGPKTSSPPTLSTTSRSTQKGVGNFLSKHGGKLAVGGLAIGGGLLAYNHYKNKNNGNI